MKKRIISLALLLLILVFSACGGGAAYLASTPLDVYEDVNVGMNSGEVYSSVDPEYGKEAAWIVNFSNISIEGGTLHYTPTEAMGTNYWAWIFMPRFSTSARATAVFFEDDKVISVLRMDYSQAADLINRWGSSVLW